MRDTCHAPPVGEFPSTPSTWTAVKETIFEWMDTCMKEPPFGPRGKHLLNQTRIRSPSVRSRGFDHDLSGVSCYKQYSLPEYFKNHSMTVHLAFVQTSQPSGCEGERERRQREVERHREPLGPDHKSWLKSYLSNEDWWREQSSRLARLALERNATCQFLPQFYGLQKQKCWDEKFLLWLTGVTIKFKKEDDGNFWGRQTEQILQSMEGQVAMSWDTYPHVSSCK